jgi:hypothetical protein
MMEHQRLFLVQAKKDYSVFNLLRKQPELPDCHLLHYLQMATELFGIEKCLSFSALRLRFRLVASDFPGIVCILDGD